MSTLASSPSPVASPHAAFHPPPPSKPTSASYAPSSSSNNVNTTRSSPRLSFPTGSPSHLRAFHAPPPPSPPPQPHTALTSGSRQPRDTPRPDRADAQVTTRYADRGTQYSPPGFPPTALPSKVASLTAARPPSAGVVRKRRDTDLSSSPQRMSTLSASASASPPAPPASSRPPLEPEPRLNPPTTAQTPPTSNLPQEARSTHGHSSAPKRSRPSPGATKLMPILYQDASAQDIGILIANMLMELIRLNDRIPLHDNRLTRFHSRAPPGISVTDYLQRLIHHATLSPPILLSMVWYIDRLCQLYPAFTINSLTVHRFLITVATVAAKGLSDSFWTNPTYARIGGIPVSELATLELEFLQKVTWRIVPRPETLEDYYRSLVERTEGYELEKAEESDSSESGTGTSRSDSSAISEDAARNEVKEEVMEGNNVT